MPLARTPPPNAATAAAAARKAAREHTFSPSQAYPDDAFRPNTRMMHTPPPGEAPAVPAAATSASASREPQPEAAGPSTVPATTPSPEKPTEPASAGRQSETDAMDVEAIIPATETAMDVDVDPPAQSTSRRSTFEPRTPRARQSMPAPRASPSPERDNRSRLKRARQSLAAGMLPSSIPVEPEPEPFSEPEAEAKPPTEPAHASPYPEHAPVPTTPAPARHTAQPAPEAGPSHVTPGRRLSRAHQRPERTPAQVLAEPAVKIPDTGDAEFGKYYEALVRTLRLQVVDRGLSRLTLEEMRECYPLLAAAKPEMFENVWASMLHKLREETLNGAMKLLADYRVAKRMRNFADMIDDAHAWAREHPGEGRPDAWRPDLTPFVLSAGANLDLYDEAWERLRDEYRETTGDCAARAQRVQEKLARLRSLDDGVSDSVVELEQANALLEHFPKPEMLEWSESVENRLGGRR